MVPLSHEWSAAAQKTARAVRVVCGTSEDVRSFADVKADLSPPGTWASLTADVVLSRLEANALQFRGNYSRLLAAWAGVCAVRHPLSALWLTLIASVSFHALVVRRGMVHVPLPKSSSSALPAGAAPQLTLMYPQLHWLLALGSVIAVLLVGRVNFVASVLLPPLMLCAAHGALREPPSRAAAQQRALELSTALRAALRGGEVEDDELEGGEREFEPPPRSEEMARRVEQIRQKYRPPTKSKLNQD